MTGLWSGLMTGLWTGLWTRFWTWFWTGQHYVWTNLVFWNFSVQFWLLPVLCQKLDCSQRMWHCLRSRQCIGR